MLLERKTTIGAPLPRVFAFFSDPRNLARITPPELGFEIVSAPSRKLRAGDRIGYRIRVLGVPIRWVTVITSWEEGRSFTDAQERGPYKRWVHTHGFAEASGEVVMSDRVEYEMPFGPLGTLAHALLIRRQLRAIFDYRENKIREIFGNPLPSTALPLRP